MPSSKGLRKDELKEKWEKFWNNYIRPSKYPLSGLGADEIFRKYIKETEDPSQINDSPFSVIRKIRGADGFPATFSVRYDFVHGPESENLREILRMGPEDLHRYYKYKKEKFVPTGIRVSVENEEHETIGQVKWGLLRDDRIQLARVFEPGCKLQLHPGSYPLSHFSEQYNKGLPRALEFLAGITKVASRHSPGDKPWVFVY